MNELNAMGTMERIAKPPAGSRPAERTAADQEAAPRARRPAPACVPARAARSFRSLLAAAAIAAGLAPSLPAPAAAQPDGVAGARETPSGHSGAAQYAIVINGDDSFTHNYNVAFALSALARLGYEPANTFVLAPAPASPAPAVRRFHATREGLREALRALRETMGPRDLLLVYLTGHGTRFFGQPALELASGFVTAKALAKDLSQLPFGRLILIADQCYSGGFLEAVAALGRNTVAVASVDARHEVRCEPFVRPLWLAALAAENANREGMVPVESAFRVASQRVAGAAERVAAGASAPLYAATGTCAGHDNLFSAAGAAAAVGSIPTPAHGDHSQSGGQIAAAFSNSTSPQ